MKPTFIGIGVQKCATTWLYDALSQHPQVGISKRKELDFFSYWWDQGFQKYEKNFSEFEDKTALGEISPSYFYHSDVPERIYSYNPDVKLIVMLRDPVDRIISNHKHEIRLGNVGGGDVSLEHGLLNNPSYLEQSCYATHLKQWFRWFSRENVLILFFDEVKNSPAETIRRTYEFIGVNASFSPHSLNEKSNESYEFRSIALGEVVRHIRSLVKKLGGGWFWRVLVKVGFRNIYRQHNKKTHFNEIPPLKSDARKNLFKQLESEISGVEAIVGRTLQSWRKED